MKDKIARWIAWALPNRVVYWCAIRLTANATTGKYGDTSVPDLLVIDALDRWEVSA